MEWAAAQGPPFSISPSWASRAPPRRFGDSIKVGRRGLVQRQHHGGPASKAMSPIPDRALKPAAQSRGRGDRLVVGQASTTAPRTSRRSNLEFTFGRRSATRCGTSFPGKRHAQAQHPLTTTGWTPEVARGKAIREGPRGRIETNGAQRRALKCYRPFAHRSCSPPRRDGRNAGPR